MQKFSKIKKSKSLLCGITKDNRLELTQSNICTCLTKEFEILSFKETTDKIYQLQISYQGEQYEINLFYSEPKVEDVFAMAHKLTQNEAQVIQSSKEALFIELYFGKDNLTSYHLQIKLLHCLVKNLLVVIDYTAQSILSGKWCQLTAKSKTLPCPAYLYAIQMMNTTDGTGWLHTHGLNRCGYIELEILDVKIENIVYYYNLIQTIAWDMITLCPDLGNEYELIIVSGLLPITWIGIDNVLQTQPKYSKIRQEAHSTRSGVIFTYLSEQDILEKKYHPISSVDEFLKQNTIFFVSPFETQRISCLAMERIHYLKQLFLEKANRTMVKYGIPYVQYGTLHYEYLWFELLDMDINECKLKLLNEPYFATDLKKSDQIIRNIKEITDWCVTTPMGKITPDDIYLIL